MRAKHDFVALRRRGRRSRSGPLSVTHLPRSDREVLHVAYAIGRPVGTAVTRNRIKRRLRAGLDGLEQRGRAPAPGDLLIRVGPGAERCDFHDLEHHLVRSFERLNAGVSS